MRPRKFLARLEYSNEEDEPMLARAYLADLLGTQVEVIEYWEDVLCCSADLQLTFEPYSDEVDVPVDEIEEGWRRESFYSTFVQPDSRNVSFNNDLYPHEEDETTVYYTMSGTEMKQERTNRKYPIKQLLTENEKKETIYVPYQAPTRTFTRADQYGTTSHKTEPGKVFPSSTAYPRAVP